VGVVVLVVGTVGTGPSERGSSPAQPPRTRSPARAMSRCRRMSVLLQDPPLTKNILARRRNAGIAIP
jgi:hypothetical protein